MDKEILSKYLEAGKINKKTKEYAKKIIKPQTPLLEIAEKIESFIKNQGADLAFPVNLSLNNIAAHYTPEINDKTAFTENDLLKVDIGIHIDGYISDSAFSISFNPEHKDLIKASEEALKNAIKLIQPGLKISEIGKTIEQTIHDYGFKPVSNLTGHGLEQYQIHARYSIPNIYTTTSETLKENDVIAIEPFATTGSGSVRNSSKTMIYSLIRYSNTRSLHARKILNEIKHTNGLPFAKRHIKSVSGLLLERSLKELEQQNIIHSYPVLKEIENSFVSQSEHTIIVKEKPMITTL